MIKEEVETTELINILREKMVTISNEERMELINLLIEGYCEECGSAYLPCYCMADD